MKRIALSLLMLLCAVDGFAQGRKAVIWDSTTTVNTVVFLPLQGNYQSVEVNFLPTGTITGGTLNFEATDDGATWYAASLARTDTLASESTFALNGAAKQAWHGRFAGFAQFQVRLSPAITGTGSIYISVNSSSSVTTGPNAVSGTVTTIPPANASTNITQFGGNSVATGTGVGGVGIPRVTISNDSSLAANQSVNAAQINGVTPLMGNGITGTGSLRVTLASDTTSNTNPFLVNLSQVNSVALLAGNGVTGTGSPRVTISSDNTPFPVKTDQTTHGTTDLVAADLTKVGGAAVVTGTGIGGAGIPRVTISSDSSLAANQSVNVAQINGVATTTGNGISGTGVQRVTIASDSTGQITLAAGAATIGSLAANQSTNVAQINGITPLMGNGITGTGSSRVTISSDNTPFPVKLDQTTPGTTNAASIAQIGATTVVTGGVAGTLGVGGPTANNAAPTGNPEQIAGYSWTDGTAPTATTAGNVTRLLTTTDGRLVVTSDHPKRFSCSIFNSTATALTALGGSCAAPGASLSLYITDINFSTSVASTTTADQQPELKYGTGGTCGTGTTTVWNQFTGATSPVIAQFITPIKVPANNELCWMMAAAGNKSVIVNGFIAP